MENGIWPSFPRNTGDSFKASKRSFIGLELMLFPPFIVTGAPIRRHSGVRNRAVVPDSLTFTLAIDLNHILILFNRKPKYLETFNHGCNIF
jgi:hypothetical protein